MNATAMMSGARLAYVVREIPGTVKREKIRLVANKRPAGAKHDTFEWRREMVEEPGGYMVYFPRGHAMRIPEANTRAGNGRKAISYLEYFGLNLKPVIINMSEWANPNSPIGKLMLAQDDDARRGAMADMETLVIRMATHQSGPVLLQEQAIDREAA